MLYLLTAIGLSPGGSNIRIGLGKRNTASSLMTKIYKIVKKIYTWIVEILRSCAVFWQENTLPLFVYTVFNGAANNPYDALQNDHMKWQKKWKGQEG